MNQPLLLIISALACYRLALLLSSDTGPWKLLSRFRYFLHREEQKHPALKKSDALHGLECVRCSSLWLASIMTSYIYFHDQFVPWFKATGDTFLLGMALSSAVIIINRILPSKT